MAATLDQVLAEIHAIQERARGGDVQRPLWPMIVRGSLERRAPALMTALTAGSGLVPLVLGGQQPGKEILYPVATVILGGTSTICEYVVHPGLFWRFSGPAAKRLTEQPHS